MFYIIQQFSPFLHTPVHIPQTLLKSYPMGLRASVGREEGF